MVFRVDARLSLEQQARDREVAVGIAAITVVGSLSIPAAAAADHGAAHHGAGGGCVGAVGAGADAVGGASEAGADAERLGSGELGRRHGRVVPILVALRTTHRHRQQQTEGRRR